MLLSKKSFIVSNFSFFLSPHLNEKSEWVKYLDAYLEKNFFLEKLNWTSLALKSQKFLK